MNYSMIRYVLLKVVELTGALMTLPMMVAAVYGEWKDAEMFAVLVICCFLIGFIGGKIFRPVNRVFFAREGFVVTALSWLLISMIGALPFVLSGTTASYVDALFETVSGFTTTGASILKDAGAVRYGVQFWRCFTHWIGGMGVLVFMLAILPMADGYSMHLMRAESPGPAVGKFVPRVKDTAKILYVIYIGFTLIEIVLLKIAGLNLYEASTLTFSTVGTGGFSLVSSGCKNYPLAAQTIMTVFMALCGINFSVYYLILTRRFKEAWHCDEMRWYLITMLGSGSLIAFNIYRAGLVATPYLAFHHAMFTVSSIMTTTGFATLDYNVWPQFSRTLLFILTLIGACAGSTGGGLKFSRLVILVRNVRNELVFTIYPKSMRRVMMDGHSVEGTTVKSVSAYLACYVFIFFSSFLIVSTDGFDFETNISAIAATFNNVGPGLNMVGPIGNYSEFSDLSKIVMILDMLAGRLEIMPLLTLFSFRTWKK